MIDTNQWRASIGAFNISNKSVRTCIHDKVRCGYDCLEFMEYEVSSTCNYLIVWFLSAYYVLNVFFLMCLIFSGDIETNPGPITTKTCPSCDAQIHIRKKICTCGYAFNQNYQNLKAVNMFPICASPSSYTGTLNPDVLIELDDTTLDISCRTQTKNRSKEGENKMVATESEGESESENEGEIETESENKMVDTETEGEIDRVDNESMSVDFYAEKGSLSQLSEGSIKWGKRSEEVNAKRRLQYKLNPIGKRLINQSYYYSQPETRREKVLHAYHSNPSPAKRRMRDTYHANPSPIKEKARQRAREAYSTNPSPIKEKARERRRETYSTNPSPIKEKARQRAREAYSTNPSPIKEKARERRRETYSTNPSPIKEKARQRAREAYNTNPSPIKEKARHRAREAYSTNPSPMKKRAKEFYKSNPSP